MTMKLDAQVGVEEVCQQLGLLRQKHGRTLEMLSSALVGQRRAELRMQDMEQEKQREWTQKEHQIKTEFAEHYRGLLDTKDEEIRGLQDAVQELNNKLDAETNELLYLKDRLKEAKVTYAKNLEELESENSTLLGPVQKRLEEKEEELKQVSLQFSAFKTNMQGATSMIDQLRAELEKVKSKCAELEAENKRLSYTASEAQTEASSTRANMQNLEAIVETLRAENEQVKGSNAQLDADLHERIRMMEKMNQENEELRRMCKSLRDQLDQAHMNNGKSKFGEFVEIKSTNKKLSQKVEKMKKQINKRKGFSSSSSSSANEELANIPAPNKPIVSDIIERRGSGSSRIISFHNNNNNNHHETSSFLPSIFNSHDMDNQERRVNEQPRNEKSSLRQQHHRDHKFSLS